MRRVQHIVDAWRWVGWGTRAAGAVSSAIVVLSLSGCRPDAPVDVALSRWQLTLAVVDEDPTIRVDMSGMVLRATSAQPVLAPVFPLDTTFSELCLNGQAATPVRSGDWFCVALNRRGPFDVTARLFVKAADDRGERSLALRRPGYTEASVSVSATQALDVAVAGVGQVLRGDTVDGTHGVIPVGLTHDLRITWHDARPVSPRAGTASVTPSVFLTVEARVLRADMLLDIDVIGGQVAHVDIRLPPETDNVTASGPLVRDFRVQAGVLRLFFRGAVAGRTTARLAFQAPRASGGAIACPQLAVLDGRVAAGGWLLVRREAQGILLEDDVTGLEPVGDLEVPAGVRALAPGRPEFFYRWRVRGMPGRFDLVTSTPFPTVETIVDRADVLYILRPGGEEIVRIAYLIRNSGQPFLRLSLPPGARVLSATVEDRACKVSADQGEVLLPLAKSIQTLGGLVPFPAEIIYCRQSAAITRGDPRVVDLPELDGVPVAVMALTAMCPETTVLEGYQSRLRQVAALNTGGETWSWRRDDDESVAERLGRNYYAAGYEAYMDNRLEEAASYLAQVGPNVPGSRLAGNAGDLLGNIDAGRADVATVADKTERAKLSRIKQTLTSQNPAMEAEQEALISAGLANIEEGDEVLGVELLKQADRVGAQLTQRSASKHRQKALAKTYSSKLNRVESKKTENRKLRERLAELREGVRVLFSRASDPSSGGRTFLSGPQPQAAPGAARPGRTGKSILPGSGARVLREAESDSATRKAADVDRSRRFLDTLAAAPGQQLDQQELQVAAFGDVETKARVGGKARVGQDAQAKQYWQEKKGKGRKAVSKGSKQQRKAKGSLDAQNHKLAAQVQAIEQALQAAQADTVTQPAVRSEGQYEAAVQSVRRQAGKAGRKVQSITQSLADKGKHASVNDLTAEKELAQLEGWAMANTTAFGQFDAQADRDLKALQTEIGTAKTALAAARQRRHDAKNVVLNVEDIVNVKSAADQASLQQFLSHNYLAREQGGQVAFEVMNGEVNVRNTGANTFILNDALENLRDNHEQVVPVVGRNAIVSVKQKAGLNPWFKDQAQNGLRYTVLDEAQYRTLTEASSSWAGPAEQRDIIVGTTNTVVAQGLAVSTVASGYNGFVIGGTRVDVPHDKYLAVDNGGSISVLKAGETRNWQEQTRQPVTLAEPEHFEITMPEMGVSFLFEKVLLGAGESPDITLRLR